LLYRAIRESFRKLDPRRLWLNPVVFATAGSPSQTPARNLLLFGGGGAIASFPSVKAIDAILAGLQLQ
jgi:high-affinity K+ transport system ATPase subunit B